MLLKAIFTKEDYKIKLTKYLKNLYKNKEIMLIASGSSAIYIALKDIENKNGRGYVITSNYSCKAIPRSIIKAGFKPIFIDINKNLSIDDKLLIKSIRENKKKVKAIIAWHPEGFTFDEKIVKIARKFRVPLIEDCASSLALIGEKLVGFQGDYAILSFRTGKLIHGGGGVLITKNKLNIKLSKKNSILVLSGIIDLIFRKIYGWEKPKAVFDHFFDKIGRIKISNKEAFLAYEQIKNLEEIRNRRFHNFNFITKNIELEKTLELGERGVSPTPTSLILIMENRNEFVDFMKKQGISISTFHNHINSEVFKEKTYGNKISKEISKKIVHIPVHEYLKEVDLNKIIGAIGEWNSKKK